MNEPAWGASEQLAPEHVTRSAPAAIASATVGSYGRRTAPGEQHAAALVLHHRDGSLGAQGDELDAGTSSTNPVIRKFEVWTLRIIAVRAVMASR